jgi:hypothetical protein
MINTIGPVTVTRTGLAISSQGDHPTEIYTFGKILLIRKDHCVVLVSSGPMAGKKINMPLVFPATVDGVIYHVDVPHEIDKMFDKAKPPRAPRVKAAEGETKIAKCRAIYAAAPVGATKEEIIAKFIADAGCTPQGAVTYYITCRKG